MMLPCFDHQSAPPLLIEKLLFTQPNPQNSLFVLHSLVKTKFTVEFAGITYS